MYQFEDSDVHNVDRMKISNLIELYHFYMGCCIQVWIETI